MAATASPRLMTTRAHSDIVGTFDGPISTTVTPAASGRAWIVFTHWRSLGSGVGQEVPGPT